MEPLVTAEDQAAFAIPIYILDHSNSFFFFETGILLNNKQKTFKINNFEQSVDGMDPRGRLIELFSNVLVAASFSIKF